MTGKTHQIAGLTVGLGYFLLNSQASYNPATLSAILVGSSLAALLPDIDQSASVLWDKIPVFGNSVGRLTSRTFFGHRNLTHSFLGIIIFGLIAFHIINKFPDYWGINHNALFQSFLAAYISHLVLDSVTIEGLPIFFPFPANFGFPPKPLEGIRIMTGEWFENLILFPAFDLAFLLLIVLNWQKIQSILFK